MVVGNFARPLHGPSFSGSGGDLPCTGGIAWQSNGGPNRGHPARSLPFTLDVPLGGLSGLVRVHLVGAFALHADPANEPSGTLGASLQLVDERGDALHRQDLLNGRHYSDARDLRPLDRVNGDGTSVHTLGSTRVEGDVARVDVLAIDLPRDISAASLRLKDLGSPASFVVFDVLFEAEPSSGCPFHSSHGGVSLAEIASIVRVGDRVRFLKALDQLESAVSSATDLDEARGQSLTFLAMVTAGALEMGGSRAMHRVQLEAARELDRLTKPADVAAAARRMIEEVASMLFRDSASPSSYLVDRALAIVDRHYAKNLTDSAVAGQLGLSTSHFRFLFKETTGQPFHKYLVAMRLEKARLLLVEEEMAVSAVAKAVGFTGLSHFSRAFTQRFSVSPTQIRRGTG
ncbi:AraC family transcriptional regulator [Fimbriimonas ginsengisoli Gsoil 348]|uniref:AraC family transcriptional regulator n=2 Tax=Fimbriimonas ginsengisoli TaxID=1005039 RepID=A0A068NXH4_FIMGI|nr:AraC family transcriptional regulator [Fimbriimonas ginsengisoli Gsoil 348]